MNGPKRIGILTSGGDCAGLNAVIRAASYRAIDGHGWQVFGVRDGTVGLMRRPVDHRALTLERFDGNILRQGGTILGTINRGDPFACPMPDGTLKDRSKEIIEGYHLLGLDALIVAGGADVILIPELRYTLAGIADKIGRLKNQDRDFALVVVAEAAQTEDGSRVTLTDFTGAQRVDGIGNHLGPLIAKLTGAETRVIVLGHGQRGGTPLPRDRVFTSSFGVHAVGLIAAGMFDPMVSWSNRQCIDVPLADAIALDQSVELDGPLVRTARGLGIYIGV